MHVLPLRLSRLAPLALVVLVVAAPTCAKDAPPPPAPPPLAAAPTTSEIAPPEAITKINHVTCAVIGTRGDTTVIDWQPADPNMPVQVRWETTGKPAGYTVQIKALTGPGEQSPDAEKQKKILEMFERKYDIGGGGQSVKSGLPKNPPFGADKEVRWKYQVQVLDAAGKVVCGKDPDVCIRQPGGCGA